MPNTTISQEFNSNGEGTSSQTSVDITKSFSPSLMANLHGAFEMSFPKEESPRAAISGGASLGYIIDPKNTVSVNAGVGKSGDNNSVNFGASYTHNEDSNSAAISYAHSRMNTPQGTMSNNNVSTQAQVKTGDKSYFTLGNTANFNSNGFNFSGVNVGVGGTTGKHNWNIQYNRNLANDANGFNLGYSNPRLSLGLTGQMDKNFSPQYLGLNGNYALNKEGNLNLSWNVGRSFMPSPGTPPRQLYSGHSRRSPQTMEVKKPEINMPNSPWQWGVGVSYSF